MKKKKRMRSEPSCDARLTQTTNNGICTSKNEDGHTIMTWCVCFQVRSAVPRSALALNKPQRYRYTCARSSSSLSMSDDSVQNLNIIIVSCALRECQCSLMCLCCICVWYGCVCVCVCVCVCMHVCISMRKISIIAVHV
jgi:hypothetical protein